MRTHTGKLFALIRSRMEGEQLSAMEAWALVKRAISRSIYYSREEFEKLPKVVREVVGSPENLHSWASMEEWHVQNNLAPWFLRAYSSRMDKDLQCRLLPSELPRFL